MTGGRDIEQTCARSGSDPGVRARHGPRARGAWLALAACACALGTSAAVAATHALIIAGLGGEPAYEQKFREQAATIAAAAAKVTGDPARVVTLSGDRARRDSVRREMKALASRLGPDDAVTIVLIGHGTFDGEEYRFNVPGPDLTGSELGGLFDGLPAVEQLIVNATSASGATLERWQRPRRIVITATKSGGERTATRFAEHWAKAVSSDAGDTNKDGVVTAIEAYEYAAREVEASFKAEVALATEHSRIAGEAPAQFTVARLGPAPNAEEDPQVRAMLARREGVERAIEEVKARRASLSEDEYYDALETVLVELALLQRQIDTRQAAAGGQ